MRRMMMAFVLAAGAWAAPAHADGGQPAAKALTPTVKAGGVEIRLKDLLLTPRPGKLFVLWDAFSYRQALADAGDGAMVKVAAGLAKDYALKRNPKAKLVHINIVEYRERDTYDTPRYESAKMLAQYEVAVDPKTHKPSPPKLLPQ